MSNAPVPAAATGLPTRRQIVSTALAAATLPLAERLDARRPAGPASAANPDPVFGAIIAHRAAREALNTLDTDDDLPAWQALSVIEIGAWNVLVATMPTTLAGAAAQLQQIAEFWENAADFRAEHPRIVLSRLAAALRQIGGAA